MVQQDTLSELGRAEPLTAVTQARQGEIIEKQSPTVLIFGFKMLSLEAE